MSIQTSAQPGDGTTEHLQSLRAEAERRYEDAREDASLAYFLEGGMHADRLKENAENHRANADALVAVHKAIALKEAEKVNPDWAKK